MVCDDRLIAKAGGLLEALIPLTRTVNLAVIKCRLESCL